MDLYDLNFLFFVPPDFYQAKRRVVWMPRKSGEWLSVHLTVKVPISPKPTQTVLHSGILCFVQTAQSLIRGSAMQQIIKQQKGLQLHFITMRLIRVLYSLWVGVDVFLSGKKGTLEQRRLTIISLISGFILTWITGMPMCWLTFPTVHSTVLNILKLHISCSVEIIST